MAKARVSSRKPKSALERDRYTAELSTGQLVIGVCILLSFGLGCFLLGVLIGKFDPTLQEQIATASQVEPESPRNVQSVPAAPERDPARPMESSLPPEIRAPRNLEPAPDPIDVSAAGVPARSQSTDLSPQASQTQDAGRPSASTEPSPPASVEPAQPAPTTAASPPPPATESAPERVAEAAPPPPVQRPAAQPARTDSRGIYGVQIIAVARPRAEGVKRDIEARSAYKAQIVPIDGDRLCKVVVGSFADERTALRARDEMRRTYQFRDAFVVPLR